MEKPEIQRCRDERESIACCLNLSFLLYNSIRFEFIALRAIAQIC